MLGFVVRRIVSGLLVLLVTSVSIFALFFYGPADPALAYCPEMHCSPRAAGAGPAPACTSTTRSRSSTPQYMKGIFVGRDFQAGAITIECPAPCLGVSFKLRTNVTSLLWSRFPATAVDRAGRRGAVPRLRGRPRHLGRAVDAAR